jgi:hypothetical protein
VHNNWKNLFCTRATTVSDSGKKSFSIAILLMLCLALTVTVRPGLALEATWEYSVQVSATVQSSPAQIKLSWPQDTVRTPLGYVVYRKALDDASWGPGTVLSGSITNFVDNNVTDGFAYEYQIVKTNSTFNGYGYVYAGIDAPLTESRGTVILLVDNTMAPGLVTELTRLQQDLVGDGWTVLRHDVARTSAVPDIKAIIQADYQADPANVNTVFLFGHVPVPYSGDIAPDGHVPDHRGAWPADVYYGDMDGTWTDNTVNDIGASSTRNRNVPGDGKFDQSSMPAPVKLMVGRVDLSSMPGKPSYNSAPTFPGELELSRNYLNKDHNFRHKLIDVPQRGLVGDYFGIRDGESFAASGWRNFAPFFGPANVTSLPIQRTWIATLQTNACLWAYGCGGGDVNSLSGIGTNGTYNNGYTTDLVQTDARAVFTMVFGSWHGDWDVQDDFMRAILATPTYGLTCVWSGRPHWFFQHMALGKTIGYSTRLTQNNGFNRLYLTQTNKYASQIHIALMGDPTLRMHVVAPPGNLASSNNSSGVNLSWTPSSDSVAGYYIYRAQSAQGPFTRLNDSLINATSFTDAGASRGTVTYMVRAVKLENTPSGTYFNASQGIFSSLNVVTQGLATVTMTATSTNLSRFGTNIGVFTFTRAGDTSVDLTLNYVLDGTAGASVDYQLSAGGSPYNVLIPAGANSATLGILPQAGAGPVVSKSVVLALSDDPGYIVGSSDRGTMIIAGNCVPHPVIQVSSSGATLKWKSATNQVYHVAYKTNVDDPAWTDFGTDIPATGANTSWLDTSASGTSQRFYCVFQVQ